MSLLDLPSEIIRKEIAEKYLSLIERRIADHIVDRRLFRPIEFTEEMIEDIVSHGLSMMVYFWDLLNKKNLCTLTIKYGNLDALRYCRSHNCPWNEETLEEAARQGNMNIFSYCMEESCPFSEKVPSIAAENGHLSLVKYLKERGIPIAEFMGGRPMRSGSLDLAIYMNLNHANVYLMCLDAASHGHLHIVEWFHANRAVIFDNEIFLAASLSRNMDLMKYLYENRCPWNYFLLCHAVKENNLDIIKFFHEKGHPLIEDIVALAAETGRREILQYCLDNDSPISFFSCSSAEQSGHLECIKLLRKYNHPLDKYSSRAAAWGGHLNILKYCIEEEGLLLHKRICKAAKSSSHSSILEYTKSRGCTCIHHDE